MRTFILWAPVSIGALVMAAPLMAAEAEAPAGKIATSPAPRHPENGAKPAITKGPPNFDAMFAVFDKMFPPQPDPDPARLALARVTVQPMWPDGAYGKMMESFLGGMFDRVMQMKSSDFVALGNKPTTSGASATKANLSLHDQAAAKDPHFDQRMAAMRDILDQEMVKISAAVDPHMRDGLARALARRFSAGQLTDINAFFATPSGHAMAGQYMQLWLDPDTIRSMMGSLPEMMKLMPEMTEKFKAVEDKYPKPAAASKK